jgi:hypothetical protein
LSQVGPPLAALLGVLFILLYTYSMIGMMFFCNELVDGNVDGTDYDESDFYALNFNDLAHSLIALFYQLVVNDWWILMEAVVVTAGDAARIFFISFYCISVLIVFSVCTAFVVEAYMDLHEAKVANAAKGKSDKLVQVEAIPMPQPVSLAPGMARDANSGGPVHGALRSHAQEDGQLRERRGSLKPSKSFRQFHQAVHRGSMGGGRHSVSMRDGPAASVSGGGPVQSTASFTARPASGSLANLAASRRAEESSMPTALAHGSGAAIPDKMEVATEALLLSRIRERASSMGLRVKLKPSGGMFNTLKNMFASELDETEDGEETEDTEDAD